MSDALLIATPKFGGFTETFIYRHVTELTDVRPIVLAYLRINKDIYPAKGIDVYTHAPKPWARWRSLAFRLNLRVDHWSWPQSSVDLAVGLCRENNVKAIMAYYGPVAVCLPPVIRQLNLPVIAHFLGYDASMLLKNRKYVSMLQETWPFLSKVIVPSKFLGERLLEAGCPGDIMQVLHLGVPIPPAIDRDRESNEVTFLHIGRLTEKKGVTYSIRAFAKALASLANARFIIVGEGKEREACLKLVTKYGIGERVCFYDYLPNSECQELYRKADIFVQHSVTALNGDTEGLPVSILEAQSNGLPVISTRHAGIPEEVVDGRTGFLVEERDVEAMAACMIRIGSDPGERLRMGEAARANIQDHFELASQNRALESIIIEAIRTNRN